MCEQDIYGCISDDCIFGEKCTSSRRGMVKSISFRLFNAWDSKTSQLDINTSGILKKKDTSYAKERIEHFTELGNKTKIEFWAKRYAEWKIENKKLRDEEFIEHDLTVDFENKLNRLTVNNTIVDKDVLTLLQFIKEKKWIDVISIISKVYNDDIDINHDIIANKI